MSALKSELALVSQQKNLIERLKPQDPLLLNATQLLDNDYQIDLLLLDMTEFKQLSELEKTPRATKQKIGRKILIVNENEKVDTDQLTKAGIYQFKYESDISEDWLSQLWLELRQIEQDESYLHLSSELNQQYEVLKTELQSKLNEKSLNIVESRKQIFEINNRVEVLRKSLYTTTEVKSLTEAEAALNDLLIKFGMITWFKIIRQSERQQFEIDLKSKTESTVYISELLIGEEKFYLFYFKGDKRNFRKSDINYFNKLTEALQINLSRYNNLLSLQQSERLFDLAFHSSPHPIIIVDKDYHVYQANLAAENSSSETHENLKCHQLLFKSAKPCAGCQLGSRFEIQNNYKTFAVQSNRYSNATENENVYWVHLYENITEQKTLEIKYQQTAKLSEVGLITSSIAHELNNPLGGILSYLQIMKMELPAEHPFQQEIQHLLEAALRMKKHIEDLLFFSRKEDQLKIEKIELNEVFLKTLDHLQMLLKKEHLVVSFQPLPLEQFHTLSTLHFRNIIHLAFQFLLHKLKLRRQLKMNFSGLVEVKISQDQGHSYLSLNANLGPHDIKQTSNDLSLITLEKSLLDQGFQLIINEPKPAWVQVLIKMPFKE